jgi:hypothetical protein
VLHALVHVLLLFRTGRRRRAGPHRHRPALEQLEGRDVPSITYHGGPVLPHLEVEAVFLGSAWASDPTLSAQVAELGGFLNYLTNSPYTDMLTRAGYGVGRGGYAGGVIDPLSLAGSIDDGAIRNELQRLITAGPAPPPDGDRLYLVFVAPGVLVTANGEHSATAFAGYHDGFIGAGGAISYGVLPYPLPPNSFALDRTPFQVLTTVTSHELAEAVTDAQPTLAPAWVNTATGDEIGDRFAWRVVYLAGYEVQILANRHDQPLIPAGATRHPSGWLWL